MPPRDDTESTVLDTVGSLLEESGRALRQYATQGQARPFTSEEIGELRDDWLHVADELAKIQDALKPDGIRGGLADALQDVVEALTPVRDNLRRHA
jgi:hypothetical protein